VEQTLDELLRLRPVAQNRFESVPGKPGHMFGGFTVALALRAAAATVQGGLPVQSLHAHFLDPGAPDRPLDLQVLTARDGRSTAVRQVTVRQGDRTPLLLTASFHRPEDGPDWVPEHSGLPPGPDELAPTPSLLPDLDAMEVRSPAPGLPATGSTWPRRVHPFWARPYRPLGEDPALHACAIVFLSDYSLGTAIQPPGSPLQDGSRISSMDHAVWFHRPVDAADWLLYDVASASVAGGRALGQGTVRARDGRLVASFAQELLTRPART
jgi:acyl-CoA thioesterase-2